MTVTRPWLALDTATTHAVVAVGDEATVRAGRTWAAGRRHGETLLAAIEACLLEAGFVLADVGAVIVGTGPGAFTGLRVGLATAKTLAHERRLPIVGVATAGALARAAAAAGPRAGGTFLVIQPAGPRDRYATPVDLAPGAEPAVGTSRVVPGRGAPRAGAGRVVVAVDLPPTSGITPAMVRRGAAAVAGLAASLLASGGAALAAGRRDDVAALVPHYVSLPRGVPAAASTPWSPDLR